MIDKENTTTVDAFYPEDRYFAFKKLQAIDGRSYFILPKNMKVVYSDKDITLVKDVFGDEQAN